MKTIFICGTGSSGTNILKKILSEHSEIFAFPFETRFLIDPDGVIDLYKSLSCSWTPFFVDKKIKRFRKFMWSLSGKRTLSKRLFTRLDNYLNRRTPTFSPPPYIYRQTSEFGSYSKKLMDYVALMEDELNLQKYRGLWMGSDFKLSPPMIEFCPPHNKEALRKIFRSFVERVIGDVLAENNANFWCEDSPPSMLFATQIIDILPDAKFIIMLRDPRDITSSLINQRWAPSDAEMAAEFCKYQLEKWLDIRQALPSNCFYELELEELVTNPKIIVKNICNLFDIEFEETMLDIDLSHSHSGRHLDDLTKQEIANICEILNPTIARYQDIGLLLKINKSLIKL